MEKLPRQITIKSISIINCVNWMYFDVNFNFVTLLQARVIAEIIWPLAVFIILALVRLEGLKDYEKECNNGF